MILNIKETELDEKRKQKLMQGRVNLIPPRNRSNNQSKRSEYDEQVVLFEKKEEPTTVINKRVSHGSLIDVVNGGVGSVMNVESVADPNSSGNSPHQVNIQPFDLGQNTNEKQENKVINPSGA